VDVERCEGMGPENRRYIGLRSCTFVPDENGTLRATLPGKPGSNQYSSWLNPHQLAVVTTKLEVNHESN